MPMPPAFKPGPEPITAEWLRKHADGIDRHIIPVGPSKGGVMETAVFFVEANDDAYLTLYVDVPSPNSESQAIEIETGWRESEISDKWGSCRTGLGLYDKLDDLKALLEILARGNA